MRKIICLLACLVGLHTALARDEAMAQDGSYDLDCAVILCMAGGWPGVAECEGAYSYMIDRITDIPPRPPFGICSMADGSGYEAYDLDYVIGSRGARNSYTCPAGTSLYFDRISKWGAVMVFCYAEKAEVMKGDGLCYNRYTGLVGAIYHQLEADLTVEPGTSSEWESPKTVSEEVIAPPESFEEMCATANVTAPGGVTAPPLSSAGLTPLAAPSNSEICNGKWGVAQAIGGNPAHALRASCAKTTEGETVLAVTAYKGEANSLIQANVPVPAAKSYTSVRASVEFMIPEDFEAWDSGRLAFGILIGEASCASGGCAPSNQKGAMIRAQFKEAPGGSITLRNYSYHLDRTSKTEVVNSPWAGTGTKTATYGAGTNMAKPIPRGEWITMTFDVTLNDPGRANGRSVLSAWDASGNLIGATAFNGVTYRPDSTWKFNGLVMTEKYTHAVTRPPSRTQSMFYRNYKLFGGDATAGSGG
jgi:hypothetical protein